MRPVTPLGDVPGAEEFGDDGVVMSAKAMGPLQEIDRADEARNGLRWSRGLKLQN